MPHFIDSQKITISDFFHRELIEDVCEELYSRPRQFKGLVGLARLQHWYSILVWIKVVGCSLRIRGSSVTGVRFCWQGLVRELRVEADAKKMVARALIAKAPKHKPR